MGIHLPLTAEQLAASEAAYQRIKNARENVNTDEGIGVGAYNQMDWKDEFGETFANVACYATCMLLIAQYYGHNITMQDLIDNDNVSYPKAFGYTTEPFFSTRWECYGASEEVYCQKIYDELMEGKPPIVELANPGTHFVVAVGIKPGAKPPLGNDDILVMDPMFNRYVSLSESILRKGQRPAGLQITSPGLG